MSMISKLYCTYYQDGEGAYHDPFFADNDLQAIIEFAHCIGGDANLEDYALYELGEFDHETGTVTMRASKFFVTSGTSVETQQALKNKKAFDDKGGLDAAKKALDDKGGLDAI